MNELHDVWRELDTLHWSGRLPPVVFVAWEHLPLGVLAETREERYGPRVAVSYRLVPGGAPRDGERLRGVLLHEQIHVAVGPWPWRRAHGRVFARHARRLSAELGLLPPLCRPQLERWPAGLRHG